MTTTTAVATAVEGGGVDTDTAYPVALRSFAELGREKKVRIQMMYASNFMTSI